VFGGLRERYGTPVFGAKGKKLGPISDRPVPPEVELALKSLPRADPVKDKQAPGQ
jgi:hypothetical protein